MRQCGKSTRQLKRHAIVYFRGGFEMANIVRSDRTSRHWAGFVTYAVTLPSALFFLFLLFHNNDVRIEEGRLGVIRGLLDVGLIGILEYIVFVGGTYIIARLAAERFLPKIRTQRLLFDYSETELANTEGVRTIRCPNCDRSMQIIPRSILSMSNRISCECCQSKIRVIPISQWRILVSIRTRMKRESR